MSSLSREVAEAAAAPAAAPAEPAAKPARIVSIDAFRGLVMTLMLAEVMRLPGVVKALPQSRFWSFIAFHTSHVAWQGCSLHDLIQPGFSFLVGASLPFSIASRKAKGQTFARMFGHTLWRSLVLVALGVFLRSLGKPQTSFTFEDTLAQIGLGYAILFLLALVPLRAQVAALAVILLGYGMAFALYPAPGPQFDYRQAGVPDDWPDHYRGFLSHWNKNSNLAWAFDTWFLNLFPREKPFEYNGGGYCTLSFVPTLATMLLGLFAGQWLKTSQSALKKLRGLVAGGLLLLLLGLLCQWTGICPIVKRIWTPAFTLYSGGLVILMLAGFHALMEWKGWRRWAFPLVVIGTNSIAIYLMSWTMEPFLLAAVVRHLGPSPFAVLGPPLEPVLRGFAVMVIFFLILLWMYRRKIFLRI